MIAETKILALFLDIAAEAPGILTEQEEIMGVNEVIQSEREPSNKEQAMLAAANSGIDFSTPSEDRPTKREVIEILDDEDDDIVDQLINEESIQQQYEDKLPKIKEDEEEDIPEEAVEGENDYRRSKQNRTANRQYQDYELYVTIYEQEDKEEDDPEEMVNMAHYIMMHYAEKESIKKKKRKFKPKQGQFGLEAGLRHFGDRGKTAVTKELTQFNLYDVFEPLEADMLTEEERQKALTSLIFLKEKQNGDVKARSCANGSVQREHVAKEEAAAPTVCLESVFATATIDAKERRKVVTVDIPGAFLHTDNEDYVIMKMVGTLAELMVKTNPKMYRQYVILEKGKSVLYLRLQKALYGMMKSALLFYRKLVSELREMGFVINPYDPCVANKMVNGTQMTIRWHVDDLMISHVSQDEIMRVVQGIKDIYGENLAETVGTVHDYLGMTFDYSFTKEVRVNMWDYLRNVIKEFPEEITGTCATPASDHLFKVREDGRKLSEELADAFHHTVYQLLFAANRARRDIQTAVSFLTTRVKAPDEDDWGKLVRVLKYINGTRYMKLILSADEMNFTVHWYVDGSHQCHEDCRGQIGCLMTMGKGAAISSSNIMKCNTRSSTETEIISVHDKLPDIIWTRYFVECQGYDIDEYIVFQDNMSSLSLEKNGRVSSSKRTKHIKAKYFLIKDYYESGEIDLRYCPTDVMWADVLTKPLQGQKFRDMRAFLQNCPRDYDDDVELQTDQLARRSMNQQVKTVASSRECVGELANSVSDTSALKRKSALNRRAHSPTCVSKSAPKRVHWTSE